MENDHYQYLAVDYFATGEGRSVFLMITVANPKQDDYETPSSFDSVDGKFVYTPGVLKNSAQERAEKQMTDWVGDWFAHGIENLEREEFFERFDTFLPPVIKSTTEGEDQPGNFHYQTSLHVNYS